MFEVFFKDLKQSIKLQAAGENKEQQEKRKREPMYSLLHTNTLSNQRVLSTIQQLEVEMIDR